MKSRYYVVNLLSNGATNRRYEANRVLHSTFLMSREPRPCLYENYWFCRAFFIMMGDSCCALRNVDLLRLRPKEKPFVIHDTTGYPL